jgi:hypothetical protein
MRKKAVQATRIQSLVRRFLGRLEYFERIRMRELDRKRQRCNDIETILARLDEETQRDIAVLKHEYQKQKDQARDLIFSNFQQEGRRQMVETRRLVVSSQPLLEKEAKQLKTQGMALHMKLKACQANTQSIRNTTVQLEQVLLELQDLVKREGEALCIKEQLCVIESTHRRIFEAGLNRTVERIVVATATATTTMTRDEMDLVESIRTMSRECQENLVTLASVAIAK